ncbi:hypothetical protein CRYUN_Cryun06bG0060200 [Craigia yunnanensis]
MQVIFSSPATVAIIVAFFLDCTPTVTGIAQFGETVADIGGRSSGISIQIVGVKSSIPCLAILIGSSLNSKLQVFPRISIQK